MSFDREQIEARIALDLIASVDMPQIAQDALEAGFDGPATLRLAILERPTYFEVAEVLPRVLNELGLAQIPIGVAALRVAKAATIPSANLGRMGRVGHVCCECPGSWSISLTGSFLDALFWLPLRALGSSSTRLSTGSIRRRYTKSHSRNMIPVLGGR